MKNQSYCNEWQQGDGTWILPALNSWYPCKHQDDYLKIILWSPATDTQTARYKVVSMRGADIGFDLTIGMARNLIYTNTHRR